MSREDIFRYAPLLALVIFLGVKFFASRPDTSASQIKTLIQQGATVVDVRTADEYASGHIDGAINIPVDQIRARMHEIPVGKPVVLYCRSGARSANAARILRSAGRTDVYNAGSISNLQNLR